MVLIFNSLIQKIHTNELGALPQLWYSFKHYLNSMDKSFLNLRTLTVKTGQIRRCQKLEKLGRHVVAMRNPRCFSIDRLLKNHSFTSERDWAMSKKVNFLLLFSQVSIGWSRLELNWYYQPRHYWWGALRATPAELASYLQNTAVSRHLKPP